jgi:hypothetical protein
MDVDKAGIFQVLARVLIVGNGTLYALCGCYQILVPPHQIAVRRKGAIDAPRLQIDLDVLYPSLAGLQMSGES